MFKLNTPARYGLRCMIALSQLDDARNGPISLERVARYAGVSKRYLEQLALQLKRAGLVESFSGRRGGYRLARPDGEIRLLDIFDATIGPISLVACVADPECCDRRDGCPIRPTYVLLNERINEMLASIRLSDVCQLAPPAALAPRIQDSGESLRPLDELLPGFPPCPATCGRQEGATPNGPETTSKKNIH
jgi:Rrf2 family protein